MITRESEEISSVPRGGPVYPSNMVGPLTRVSEFHSCALHLLQDLEAELCLDSLQVNEDDVSVDDIKVYTEEELTEIAVQEALGVEDSEMTWKKFSQSFNLNNSKHNNSGDKNAERDKNVEDPAAVESSSENPSGSNQRKRKRKSAKKIKEKIRKKRKHHLVDAFDAKLNQLAKIKQRQDEDKLTVELHCLRGTVKTTENSTTSSFEGVSKNSKMQSLRSTNSVAKPVKLADIHEAVSVPSTEVVLCVEIYHNLRKAVKTQEFLVLGDQMLTELRDKIYCLTDQVMEKAGDNDHSGYFIIEDIFCNDLRNRSSVDYSKPVFDWLRNSKDEARRKWENIRTEELQLKQKEVLGEGRPLELPEFKAVEMHKIRFCDLNFKLGAGYLYCHQGDCKHMVVIRDMRLIHPEDDHNRAAYPRIIFQLKTRVQKCSVCKIYRASKLTVDDKWAKGSPCYFCDYCFFLLHSEEGPLSCDCLVYDYLHD